MKKIVLFILGILITVGLNASTLTTNVTTQTTNVWSTTPIALLSVVVDNAWTNSSQVTIFDANTTSLTYTSGVYTYYSYAMSNSYVWYYTNNILGDSMITTNTNTVWYPTKTTAAAATNNCRIISSFVVPSNTTVHYFPVDATMLSRGMAITNSGSNLTITVNYRLYQ